MTEDQAKAEAAEVSLLKPSQPVLCRIIRLCSTWITPSISTSTELK